VKSAIVPLGFDAVLTRGAYDRNIAFDFTRNGDSL
jgi:hypothetical protein